MTEPETNYGPTKVTLCSNQTFLAEGLRAAFIVNPGFELSASYRSLSELIERLGEHARDLILLDVAEELTVAELRDLRHAAPRSQIALWAWDISREMAFQALEAGIRGILRKSMLADGFMAALRAIRKGDLWFEKDLLESCFRGERVVLTNREGQLVTLLAQGLKNKEIAWMLQITEGTVKVYLSRLFKKLGMKDRFELALYGLKNMQNGALGGNAHPRPGSNPAPLRSMLVHGPVGIKTEEAEMDRLVRSQGRRPAPQRLPQ